jgi:hypothetical protein
MPDETTNHDPSSLSRRTFLGGVGGVTVASMAAGAIAIPPLLGGGAAEAHEIGPETPSDRTETAKMIRKDAADAEKALGVFPHPCNGDEELYPNRIGNFSKTMRHDDIGEVFPEDYDALLSALANGSFDEIEAIPKGGTGEFTNPLGGLAFNMEGPDSPATELVMPAPAFASAVKAAEAAEMYWMAFLRDVPFTDYNVNPVVQQACDDLERMSGYLGPRDGAGQVTPQLLFRYDYPGCTDGPMVSQILYRTFFYDGIEVIPKMRVRQPVLKWKTNGTFTFDALGRDFLTLFDEWLNHQRGIALGNADVFDATRRFPRSVRDVGHLAGSDRISSVYSRALLILGGLGAVVDDGNPYKFSDRQGGFATFGAGHIDFLVGSAHKGERHTWYDKWQVHRHLRPDGFGGRVDNHLQGRATYPIHSDLLTSPVLPKIAAYNRQLNITRFGIDEASFLIPMELPGGTPNHPSLPAGHAVTAGACITMLKAWFKEDTVLSDSVTVKPNRDGTALVPYVAGVDGPPLTIGGELNKLCHNLSAGRDMSGVHYRVDGLTGNFQGEEVAIRILNEARSTYPEDFGGFSLTKYDGTTITV